MKMSNKAFLFLLLIVFSIYAVEFFLVNSVYLRIAAGLILLIILVIPKSNIKQDRNRSASSEETE